MTGIYGGGDGICSGIVSSTATVFATSTANVTSIQDDCIARLSSVDQASMSNRDYNNRIAGIYNECGSAVSQNFQLTTIRIATITGIPPAQVSDAMQSGATTEPLTCISRQLTNVYIEFVAALSAIRAKTDEKRFG